MAIALIGYKLIVSFVASPLYKWCQFEIILAFSVFLSILHVCYKNVWVVFSFGLYDILSITLLIVIVIEVLRLARLVGDGAVRRYSRSMMAAFGLFSAWV